MIGRFMRSDLRRDDLVIATKAGFGTHGGPQVVDTSRRAMLDDLCTPAELEALSDRWQVVPLLLDGVPYRDIHDRTGVSVTTIGRVARCLTHGAGGYLHAATALGLHRHPDGIAATTAGG